MEYILQLNVMGASSALLHVYVVVYVVRMSQWQAFGHWFLFYFLKESIWVTKPEATEK